jgi:hypothetical protein
MAKATFLNIDPFITVLQFGNVLPIVRDSFGSVAFSEFQECHAR